MNTPVIAISKSTASSMETVNHGKNQYVVGKVHTNTIENFWSLLKRGIIGNFITSLRISAAVFERVYVPV